ncbi:mRpL24 [Trypoxylus dichotomus]
MPAISFTVRLIPLYSRITLAQRDQSRVIHGVNYRRGLNCHYRTVDRNKDLQGMVIQSEAPLLVTNQVSLLDHSDFKSTPIEWRFTEDGQKVRVPTRADKDTLADDVTEITFSLTLQTFEMSIMENMGIKDRIPPKSYWY